MPGSVLNSLALSLMTWIILFPPLGWGNWDSLWGGCGIWLTPDPTSSRWQRLDSCQAVNTRALFTPLLGYLSLTSSSFSKEPPWLLCNFLSWYLRDISTLILVFFAIYVLLPCSCYITRSINQKLCLSGYDPKGNVPETSSTCSWSQLMNDKLFIRGQKAAYCWDVKERRPG